MNVLITGGNGFIGSHFIEENINLQYISNIYNISNKSKIILPHQTNKKYKEYNLDLSSEEFINNREEISKLNIDYIIHLASHSNIDRSVKDPSLFAKSNISGLINLLECFKDSNVKKIINVSTVEVFGDFTYADNFIYEPKNPYAICKTTNELFCKYYREQYGLPIIITNCSSNFGERQRSDKFIPMCVYNLKNKIPISLYGSGKNTRNWLYVKDHVKKLKEILLQEEDKFRYTILGHSYISNYDLIHKIKEIYVNLTNDVIIDEWFEHREDRKGHTSHFYNKDIDNNLNNFDVLLTKTIQSYL
jgi:dTDP-glucose 4,6-dehydratase